MFRIEVINENEELIACQTFREWGECIESYQLIKNKYYNKFKGCTMQVFSGLNIENLRENKELEVML